MKRIEVELAGRKYPLKAKTEAEAQLITDVANAVNEKLMDYQNNFAQMEKQDYMAMTLLYFALEFEKAGGEQENTTVAPSQAADQERLEGINHFLSEILEALD